MRDMNSLALPAFLSNSSETQLLIEEYLKIIDKGTDMSLPTKIRSIHLCKIIGVFNPLLANSGYRMASDKISYALVLDI